MSKNNIRYSEYTHIWYYSGIQLFFQIGQFYSCMAIIVFECQRPKNVYQSSFRISSRKIFSYIPFFQNHSCIRVQGLTKIWLCCSFSFQHNMQVHTELKHKKIMFLKNAFQANSTSYEHITVFSSFYLMVVQNSTILQPKHWTILFFRSQILSLSFVKIMSQIQSLSFCGTFSVK